MKRHKNTKAPLHKTGFQNTLIPHIPVSKTLLLHTTVHMHNNTAQISQTVKQPNHIKERVQCPDVQSMLIVTS